MLMTKAMREKLSMGKRPSYTVSTVRVRMPEGLFLQGKFKAREPVAAIFAWVTDNLANPALQYRLVSA